VQFAKNFGKISEDKQNRKGLEHVTKRFEQHEAPNKGMKATD